MTNKPSLDDTALRGLNDQEAMALIVAASKAQQAQMIELESFKAVSKPISDITTMTADQKQYHTDLIRRIALDKSIEAMNATNTDECESVQDLAGVILKYIRYVQCYEQRGVRLYELNRRFYGKAKIYGTSVKNIMPIVVRMAPIEYILGDNLSIYLDLDLLEKAIGLNKSQYERDSVRNEYINRSKQQKR